MSDREKVIKGLECCTQHGSMCGSDCNGHYERYTDDGYVIKLVNEYRSECPYGKCETGCVKTLAKDALELLKEQEPIEPKTGKWITRLRHEHYPSGKPYEEDFCSECGKRGSLEYPFCPWCGIKMESGEVG